VRFQLPPDVPGFGALDCAITMNTTELRVFFHVASTHLMVKNQQIWGTKPEASKSLKANWVVIEQKT